jgi:hypothetical protein
MAFRTSILAMSGEETLAQVLSKSKRPKMKNFKEGGVHHLRL